MGFISQFFAAPDDVAAAGVRDGGPDGEFETAADANYPALLMLPEWDSVLTGRAVEDLLSGDEPRIVTPDDGAGSVVFAVSPELQGVLAVADRDVCARAASAWVELYGDSYRHAEADVFAELLWELAGLARSADECRHIVYCWMS